jgi:hypothetical protein
MSGNRKKQLAVAETMRRTPSSSPPPKPLGGISSLIFINAKR